MENGRDHTVNHGTFYLFEYSFCSKLAYFDLAGQWQRRAVQRLLPIKKRIKQTA